MTFTGDKQLCNIDFALYLYKIEASRSGCEACFDDEQLKLELELYTIECGSEPPGECTENIYFQPYSLLAEHLTTDANMVKTETLIRQRTDYVPVKDVAEQLRAKQERLNIKLIPCYEEETIPCPPKMCISPWTVDRKTCDPCKVTY